MPVTEERLPIGEVEGKRAYVREMFTAIAPRYDFLNHLLSLNVDRLWRRQAVAIRIFRRRPSRRRRRADRCVPALRRSSAGFPGSMGFFAVGAARSMAESGLPADSIAMKVQVAVLCDAATDYNGKLSLLGTFDTVITQQLPAVHPQCSVALRLVFERIEEGAHRVKITSWTKTASS